MFSRGGSFSGSVVLLTDDNDDDDLDTRNHLAFSQVHVNIVC